jgi:hypothetical protein
MALVLADRVKETTTTTGTGTVTLAGAATGFQSFAVIGNGNTTYYTIAGQGTAQWEVGIGTYTSAGTTLSRTTVLASSNAGSLVVFSAGTKDVFVTYPAGRSIYADGTTLTATNSAVLPGTSGGTGQSSYAVGDLLYASTTTDLSKLADVATGNALISGGVGVAPSYGKIGLTTHVSGTLPVANGGTGVTASTGTGSVVLSTSPSLTTPTIGSAGATFSGATSGTTVFKAAAVAGTTTITMPGTTGTVALTSDIPTVNNATLTMGVSGTGLSGSQTFTANQSSAATFTVTSNATSANTASAIVARDGSGNFTAGTITAALTGNVTGNVSGSSGSCTGNAATVTNGLYTTGGQTIAARNVQQGSQTAAMATATGSLGGLEMQSANSSGAAFMTFHRPGAFAGYFGLDTDNVLKVGGWSFGAVAYPLLYSTSTTAPGSTPVYGARAWVNFTPSSGAVVASGNVSSVTRNALSNYTVNFTTAFTDANYAVSSFDQYQRNCAAPASGGKTTTAHNMNSFANPSNGAQSDLIVGWFVYYR